MSLPLHAMLKLLRFNSVTRFLNAVTSTRLLWISMAVCGSLMLVSHAAIADDMTKSLYTYRAKIVSVYDGDTVRADIDLGLSIWARNEKMRLFGIDTPELRGGTPESKRKGYAARDFLRSKVLGKTVIIKTIRDKKGKYGRYLAEIFIDGVNINELLIEKGHAVEYMK